MVTGEKKCDGVAAVVETVVSLALNKNNGLVLHVVLKKTQNPKMPWFLCKISLKLKNDQWSKEEMQIAHKPENMPKGTHN